ncbi:FHA domain-containing protein [Actinoplanes sp. NPDC024001]|uniref:FHA domain-containing protein n=1 Tax=Actinoplanes sp. NPDC024001 TaxID=3154598 RepID=UPI0033F722E1
MIESFAEAGAAVPPAGTAWLGSLRVEQPPALYGAMFPLPAPEAVIGRGGAVRLESALVSRRHAIVWATGGRVWLRDAGSANGTFVNGTRLSGNRQLRDGDRIGIGDVLAIFTSTTAPEPATPAPVPAAPPEPGSARTETTRYLSAAVHLDRGFRSAVLDATVRETHRAVCPSYGVDLSVVARHALVAERRELWRDAALTVVLGAAMVLAGVWWPATSGLILAAAVLALGTVAAVAAEAWTRLGTLGRFLQWGGRPDALAAPAGSEAVLDELRRANDGNVIVFPAFDPFVGCGVLVGDGSFTVPLIPADDRKPSPLRSGEVVEELTRSLRSLSQPHMRVDTRLYVNGYNVAQFPDLLPDPRRRPRTHAPQALLWQMIDKPTGIVRPYLCVEFSSWHGQLVVTTCTRVVALPGVLYLESAAYVLPPLKAEYYDVDQIRLHTLVERLTAVAGDTARRGLPAMLGAPFRLVAAFRDAAATERLNREHRRRIAERILTDYGTATSIREQASGDAIHSHFMAQDGDMYVQIVQQRIADALTELLERRGYQTDKVKQIQNNDHSVHISGGSQNIGAIGQHARGDVAANRAAGSGRGNAK